jgi:hypothetical protein
VLTLPWGSSVRLWAATFQHVRCVYSLFVAVDGAVLVLVVHYADGRLARSMQYFVGDSFIQFREQMYAK